MRKLLMLATMLVVAFSNLRAQAYDLGADQKMVRDYVSEIQAGRTTNASGLTFRVRNLRVWTDSAIGELELGRWLRHCELRETSPPFLTYSDQFNHSMTWSCDAKIVGDSELATTFTVDRGHVVSGYIALGPLPIMPIPRQ